MTLPETTFLDTKDTKRKSRRRVWFSIFGVIRVVVDDCLRFIVRSHATIARRICESDGPSAGTDCVPDSSI